MAGGYGYSQEPQAPQARINPYAIAAQGAGGLMGAIASYLGGRQDRKDRSYGRGKLKEEYGSDIYNPYDLVGKKKLSYIASAQPLAERANQQLGLKSGRAQQELISKYAGQEGSDLLMLMLRKALAESQRDVGIAGQFYQAGR